MDCFELLGLLLREGIIIVLEVSVGIGKMFVLVGLVICYLVEIVVMFDEMLLIMFNCVVSWELCE